VDFTIPVANEMSDRVFLAASDGLMVCLHDRDYGQALENRREDIRGGTGRDNPLAQKLLEPITLTRGMVEAPLKDAAKILATRFKIPVVVAERAFQDAGEPRVLEKQVSLKKFEGVVLGEVLQRLLRPINATYVVQPDYVLIVPIKGTSP
jgi:hypothetical protein